MFNSQAGITNRLEYPMMLDGMAHKTAVAKVKWQPKWKTSSVVCLKEGTTFVDQVKSKFPNFQANSHSLVKTNVFNNSTHINL